MKHHRTPSIQLLLAVLLIVLSACDSERSSEVLIAQAPIDDGSGTLATSVATKAISLPDVEVLPKTVTQEEVVDTVKYHQPNCGGTDAVEYEYTKSRNVQYVIELGEGLEVNANGQVGLFGTDVEVGATVAKHLGREYGFTEGIIKTLTVKAARGSSVEHTIRMVEVWKSGDVRISAGTQSLVVPFKFRDDFDIFLLNSEDQGCIDPITIESSSQPLETPYAIVTSVTEVEVTRVIEVTRLIETSTLITLTPLPEPSPSAPPVPTELPLPTATPMPATATRAPASQPPVPNPVTNVISLQANEETGKQIPVTQSRFYRLDYLGDAYSPWPNENFDGYQGWTSIVRVYVNRPIQWGVTDYGLIGPIDHDDYLGSNAYYLAKEEAVSASVSSLRRHFLKAGDYISIVTLDEKGRYGDNRGKVDLGLTFLGQ